LKLESDKYCETKLFFKMDMYFETEEVLIELLCKRKLKYT